MSVYLSIWIQFHEATSILIFWEIRNFLRLYIIYISTFARGAWTDFISLHLWLALLKIIITNTCPIYKSPNVLSRHHLKVEYVKNATTNIYFGICASRKDLNLQRWMVKRNSRCSICNLIIPSLGRMCVVTLVSRVRHKCRHKRGNIIASNLN